MDMRDSFKNLKWSAVRKNRSNMHSKDLRRTVAARQKDAVLTPKHKQNFSFTSKTTGTFLLTIINQ